MTTATEIHAHNIIAQVTSAMESGATSDDVVPLIADLSDIDADKIADDMADLFEHLEAERDMRGDDPIWAAWYHREIERVDAAYIQTVLAETERYDAMIVARRIVATLRADMNRPRDLWSLPCES